MPNQKRSNADEWHTDGWYRVLELYARLTIGFVYALVLIVLVQYVTDNTYWLGLLGWYLALSYYVELATPENNA